MEYPLWHVKLYQTGGDDQIITPFLMGYLHANNFVEDISPLKMLIHGPVEPSIISGLVPVDVLTIILPVVLEHRFKIEFFA
jgi:hypothetical protein